MPSRGDLEERAPRGDLISGHASAFNRDSLGFLTMLARDYGDLVPLRFTPFRALFVNHPALVEEVLVTRNRSFVKSLAIRRARVVLGNGLVINEGDFWRRQRRLMQPAFHRERIASYGQVMVDCADQLTSSWAENDERDIQQEMTTLTLEIVGKTLFGVDLTGDSRDVGAAFTLALESMMARITGLQLLLPDNIPTPAMVRLRRAVRRLDALVYRIIAERRAQGQDGGDLLSLLLQARDVDDGSGMTDQQLRDEVMTLVFGGHETTALTLTWAWCMLAQHPRVEKTLRSELSQVLDSQTPTVAHMTELPYTNAVIAETLRLYPPIWVIAREAIEDIRVGDRLVRRGTLVLLSPWTMHRDPRFFIDPDTFNPERWLDGLTERLPRFAYLPFGAGPRQCIGNTFALVESALVLARIAQTHRLTLLPNQTIWPIPVSTLRPSTRIMLRITPRPSAHAPVASSTAPASP